MIKFKIDAKSNKIFMKLKDHMRRGRNVKINLMSPHFSIIIHLFIPHIAPTPSNIHLPDDKCLQDDRRVV